MNEEQNPPQQDKKTLQSKALRHTALFLFILSWFLPALDGDIGIWVVVQAFSAIFFPPTWPVSANLMFVMIYGSLNDNQPVSSWMPYLMLFMMIPASIWAAGVIIGWGYVIWAASGILLFADWMGSRKPKKRHLIVRTAMLICLICTLGLVAIGQHQKNTDYRYYFKEKRLSVFYNAWGLR